MQKMKISSLRRLRKPLLLALLYPVFLPVGLSAERVRGVIVETAPERLELTVRLEGEEAPRKVFAGPGDLAIAAAGNRFDARLTPQGPTWRLENIFPAAPREVAVLERLGTDLHRDTLQRGRKAFRAVGERVPPFALWDQRGELFVSESLKGKYYVINFVFTRCMQANMCPASTTRMMELAERIKAEGWEDVRLVSVTLDPAYDTPGIWTAYARSKGIDTSLHYLLGGPAETVDALKKQMGILAEPDEREIIRHTMSTALIDPTGKIIYRLPGSMWSPEVFARQIERAKAKAAG
jgi:protein SCO1